jgi:group I intron endonuclease
MYGYIYKTTNLINGKTYIGQKKSSKFEKSYYGSGLLISRAVEKYGIENFKIEILCWALSKEHLDELEILLIESNSVNENYNIAKGGDGGDTTSNNPNKLEIIEKRKEGIKKFNESLSDEYWVERNIKISNSKKGKSNGRDGYKHNQETKDKIKLANLISNSGENWTEERRNNFLAAMEKRRGVTNKTSKIFKKVIIDGIIYLDIKVAAKELILTKTTIYNWIRNGKAKYID